MVVVKLPKAKILDARGLARKGFFPSTALSLKFPTSFGTTGRAEKRISDPRKNPLPITAGPIKPQAPITDPHASTPRLSLYDSLNASYIHKGEKSYEDSLTNIRNAGYTRDDALSNDNQSVFYNPTQNRVLYAIAGTHNLSDAITDVQFALNGSSWDITQGNSRGKQALDVYEKARAKYKPAKTTIVGHSLGGELAASVARQADLKYGKEANNEVINYNKASIGRSNRHNEKSYRTTFDPVSIFSSLNKGSKTISYNKFNPLEAHTLTALKENPVWI